MHPDARLADSRVFHRNFSGVFKATVEYRNYPAGSVFFPVGTYVSSRYCWLDLRSGSLTKQRQQEVSFNSIAAWRRTHSGADRSHPNCRDRAAGSHYLDRKQMGWGLRAPVLWR